jgi:hypothetical protein
MRGQWLILQEKTADGSEKFFFAVRRSMSSKESSERREYVRAVISTEATVTRIDPMQLEKITRLEATKKPNTFLPADTQGKDVSPISSECAPLFFSYLVRIEEKLDRILEQLECGAVEGQRPATAKLKNISGSGVSLILSEPLEKDALLEISMNLPGFPLDRFDVYGKVVHVSPRVGKEKGLFDVGVKFVYINEVERERLVACSFSAMRKAIRSQSKTEPAE